MSGVRARSAACLSALLLGLGPILLPQAAQAAPEPGPGQWFLADYKIPEAWETSTGAGVKVAVIDSGVEKDHENLRGKVVAARDFTGLDKDGTTPVGPPETIHHGTAVAGVIAGTGAGAGPTGVAPDAEILSASMWLGDGMPDTAEPSREQAAAALVWAADNGARVVNMSLGWDDPSWPESWDSAFAHAYAKDVLVIACVGNSSQGATQAWSPSTVPGVVGVGGLGRDGRIREASSAPGTAVDLMGPAEDIPVPFHSGGYADAQGCSFAAPVVAGVAALIRAAEPELSADQVAAKLYASAAPVKGHEAARGIDPVVGHGRLDPVAALRTPPPAEVGAAAEDLQSWVRMHRRAPAPGATPSAPPGTTTRSTATGEQELPAASARVPRAGYAVLGTGTAVALGAGLAGLLAHRRRRALAEAEARDSEVTDEAADGATDGAADETADGVSGGVSGEGPREDV